MIFSLYPVQAIDEYATQKKKAADSAKVVNEDHRLESIVERMLDK